MGRRPIAWPGRCNWWEQRVAYAHGRWNKPFPLPAMIPQRRMIMLANAAASWMMVANRRQD